MFARFGSVAVAVLAVLLVAAGCGKKAATTSVGEPPASPVAEAPQAEEAASHAAPEGEAAKAASGEIEHITSPVDFDAVVLKSNLPVLVDFWAEWCGPCQMLAPVLESIAKKYAGKLRVVKVNVDEAPELAERYQIQAIPTLLFVSGGKIVHTAVGYMDESQLDRLIREHLLSGG